MLALRPSRVLVALAAAGAVGFAHPPASADAPAATVVYPKLSSPPARSRKLLIAGLTTFGAGYLLNTFMSIGKASASESDKRPLWGLVPVAGPWVLVALPKPESRYPDMGPTSLVMDLFVGVCGVAQGVGAIALAAYAVPPDPELAKSTSGLSITPVLGPGSLGFTGTF